MVTDDNFIPAEAFPEPQACFLPAWSAYNQPDRLVTLGDFLPREQARNITQALREPRVSYDATPAPLPPLQQRLEWTRLLTALNQERQWPLKRLFTLLDPMLEPNIALAVVPPHRAYQAFWPMRTLARQLAAQERMDATSCLVRHTSIRRITFGGPSTRALHRQTIRVENPALIAGQRVLVLDDIARSGASLWACQELLYEAGAAFVQAVALGQVV